MNNFIFATYNQLMSYNLLKGKRGIIFGAWMKIPITEAASSAREEGYYFCFDKNSSSHAWADIGKTLRRMRLLKSASTDTTSVEDLRKSKCKSGRKF
jgi:hypothetical protein